ncbi:dephospho-CoA kinase [Liquorilactobacillus oeni]|uniref:Dephospho-CoA kinase n=1 Tax=Liquorilactobacillus oeni DSM 19972 TaxID=1423777 RepID=A0A0R1M9Y9_9LACO|nr:dephospho-CoA kinase [Liquorilactobacillus oeni]KRL04753.1 dephospho-CoA kinase [Liquorilactobacillus oeni DSM 19972]
MTYVLGLTGGIASGKTTVSRFLREKGAIIIDGDLVARQIVEKGTGGLKQIKKAFGAEVIAKDGQLARKKLGEIVFAAPQKLAKLNSITAPLIHKRILCLIKYYRNKQVKLLVLDIPLLFEGGYEKYCNSVMTVYVTKTLQMKRLMERDKLSSEQAKKRVASQLPTFERNKRSQIVIDNTKEVEETLSQVLKWLIVNGFVEEV